MLPLGRLVHQFDVGRLAAAAVAGEPRPLERKPEAAGRVSGHHTSGPACEELLLGGQAVVQQLDPVPVHGPPEQAPLADSSPVVSTRDDGPVHPIVEDGVRARDAVFVLGSYEPPCRAGCGGASGAYVSEGRRCRLTSVSTAKPPQPKSETLHLSRSTKPSRRQGVARSPSGQPAPVSLQISQPKSPLPRLLPLPGEKGGIGCGTEAPPCRIAGNRADTPAGSARKANPERDPSNPKRSRQNQQVRPVRPVGGPGNPKRNPSKPDGDPSTGM